MGDSCREPLQSALAKHPRRESVRRDLISGVHIRAEHVLRGLRSSGEFGRSFVQRRLAREVAFVQRRLIRGIRATVLD